MRASRLRLKPAKMQVIWLGSGQLLRQISICHVPVLSTQVKWVESARDLGVVIDSQLSLTAHVTTLCRSGYCQLRQLRPNIRSLTADTAKTLVHAFITCRLDYCNSLLYGLSNYLLQKVQSVENAATHLITGTQRCECITPVLQKLHWLPVRRRAEFKLVCLSLDGQTPLYRASDIKLTANMAALSFNLRLREYLLFHAHTTASATEAFLLPAHGCGTPCHHICGGT